MFYNDVCSDDCIKISDLSVGYNQKSVIEKLNMTVNSGELVALIGRNGAGKTTLMRTVARLQSALSGKIDILKKPIESYSRTQLAELVSVVTTEVVNIPNITVRTLVSFGRFPHTNWIGKLSSADIQLIDEALHLTDLNYLETKSLYQISDGERQRAMIARALAQDTDIILLDEPTAFLDVPNKYEIISLLRKLTRKKQKTVLFSSHDLNIAMQQADKLWLIIDKTICEGAPEDLVLGGQFEKVFEGSKIIFDDSSGYFNIKQHNIKQIRITAKDEKNLLWTKKALERCSFEVLISENEDDADIIVRDNHTWRLTSENKSYHSIYDMIRQITSTHNE
jgi:iron complex transport system ATP-binding protein